MSQNNEQGYVNTLLKYLILTGVVYMVAMNVPSNKLSKNELLMISVFSITVISKIHNDDDSSGAGK